MKCQICKHGETSQGKTTVTLTRGDTVAVIKDVPAEICNNCGEYYLSENVTGRVYALAAAAADRHSEVEVVRYAA